ncbi:MAG: spore coat protein CotJB [Eubacterium sp.]
MMNNMMNNMDRKKLFELINQTSFALDDVKLYLDTHPNCQEALAYYEKLKKMRMQAWREYTMRFGPLSAYDVNVQNEWTWNEGQLPWEGDVC